MPSSEPAMNTAPEPLPPRGLRSWGRRHRLLLAEDHLLAVRFDGFGEEYRRFRFGDLHGFVVRRTARRAWINVVLGLVSGSLLLAALAAGAPPALTGILALLALAFAVGMVINTAAGPTCRVTVQTAVQSAPLPAWSRVADFEHGLERLQPLVAAAQGADRPERPESGAGPDDLLP